MAPKGTTKKRKLSKEQKSKAKKQKCQPSEEEMVTKLRTRESQLMKRGFKMIVGTDEAGRGPLAGPVVAAACYVPPHVIIPGVADSKALTEEQRDDLFERITTHPEVVWALSVQSNETIDKINILASSLKAMVESVGALNKQPDYVLVDGNRDPPFPAGLEFETVIKGDAKCYCIAAASIIAKVHRDRIMDELDRQYPVYLLKQHKGYPTKQHKALVLKHGPCPIHRITFAPIKTMPGIDLTGTCQDPVNIAKKKEEHREKARQKRLAAKGVTPKDPSDHKEKKISDFFAKKPSPARKTRGGKVKSRSRSGTRGKKVKSRSSSRPARKTRGKKVKSRSRSQAKKPKKSKSRSRSRSTKKKVTRPSSKTKRKAKKKRLTK